MKILQIHNRYVNPGGEDTVLAEEYNLLRARGHEVEQLLVSNSDIPETAARKAIAGVTAIWSPEGYSRVSQALSEIRPDLVHVHNTFPILSPSIYWAAHKKKIPLVQTLHNYRLTCANGLLLRDDLPCEDCVGGSPVSALKHRCYRGSLTATGSLVAMQTANRLIGSYRNKVSAYIALTEFARKIMVRAGLPENKVYVKPNFVTDVGAPPPLSDRKRQVVFLGMVDYHKGVDVLVRAWINAGIDDAELCIVGDSPDRAAIQETAGNHRGIKFLGRVPREEASRIVRESMFLVLASKWYEGLPMVLLEALQAGTPAVVSALGAMPEIVDSPQCGFSFAAGDSQALAATLKQALSISGEEWQFRSDHSRKRYEQHYTPEANYEALMEIYRHASAKIGRRN